MPEFRCILCPVDFSESSQRAFEYALALASRLGAEVEVAHVYHLSADAMPEGVWEVPSDLKAEITTHLQQQLDELVKRGSGAGVKVIASLCEGIPYVEIVRLAREHGVDMIVIGTHGRTGLAHLLLGSVAERVVRTADVPVVSVRSG